MPNYEKHAVKRGDFMTGDAYPGVWVRDVIKRGGDEDLPARIHAKSAELADIKQRMEAFAAFRNLTQPWRRGASPPPTAPRPASAWAHWRTP